MLRGYIQILYITQIVSATAAAYVTHLWGLYFDIEKIINFIYFTRITNSLRPLVAILGPSHD